jgi:hypothetical protein
MKFFEESFKSFLLNEQFQAIELNANRLNMNNLYNQLSDIDSKNFGYFYAQDSDDLKDDFEISGSYSWGLIDRTDNKIKGYILGYPPDTYDINDNREEFQNILDSNDQRLKLFNNFDVKKTSDIIFKDLSPSTGFYVSSLAINNDARKTPSSGKMVYNFLRGLKAMGKKYIIFDGMRDTLNLFLNPDGTPNERRLASAGLTLILTFPSDEDRLFSLMMINN